MTVNIPVLRKAVEWIEEQAKIPWRDRVWDQTRWVGNQRTPDINLDHIYGATGVCGTTYCMAGYIAQSNGWTPVGMDAFWKDGVTKRAAVIAREILNIERDDAGLLWFAPNDPVIIRERAEEIAGEKL